MTIDFKTCLTVLPHVINTKKPILFRGRHGIGKSELVYQISEGLEMSVIERRVSVMTEGDLIGLPVIKDDTTTFNPPDWYKMACNKAVVLFLDEVDRGTPEVAQQIFELTDSRKLNGHCLHPETLIFAAVNGGDHASNYQVRDMDPAELDRWTVFDLEPSVEDWLTWGKVNVTPIVWDFINLNHKSLEHKEEFEPNKVYPSRRSWKRYSDCIQHSGLHRPDPANKGTVFHLACGFLGFETAITFADFFENYKEIVTAKNIIEGGQYPKTVEWALNQHLALIEEMRQSGYFERKLSDKEIQNLGDYWMSMYKKFSEAAMKMVFSVGNGEDDAAKQAIADRNFIAFGSVENSDGDSVSELIAVALASRHG